MMIFFLHWTRSQVFSLYPLSPVSKGHTWPHMFFKWIRILEYFHSRSRLNMRKKGPLGQPLFPSCVWTATYFLLRHLILHPVRVSSSTQFLCCFNFLIFSAPVHWCPASMESDRPVTTHANLTKDSLSLTLTVSG